MFASRMRTGTAYLSGLLGSEQPSLKNNAKNASRSRQSLQAYTVPTVLSTHTGTNKAILYHNRLLSCNLGQSAVGFSYRTHSLLCRGR